MRAFEGDCMLYSSHRIQQDGDNISKSRTYLIGMSGTSVRLRRDEDAAGPPLGSGGRRYGPS